MPKLLHFTFSIMNQSHLELDEYIDSKDGNYMCLFLICFEESCIRN